MILVLLGTQDKSFIRLLKAIDNNIEYINDDIVVQAGHTKFESSNMNVFDFSSKEEFEELVEGADLIITHGGVGSIVDALKKGKKVIAAARLKKYGEHVNDHQLQIIDLFVEMGYILKLDDFNDIIKLIKETEKFKPKKYISTTKNVVKAIDDFIKAI